MFVVVFLAPYPSHGGPGAPGWESRIVTLQDGYEQRDLPLGGFISSMGVLHVSLYFVTPGR